MTQTEIDNAVRKMTPDQVAAVLAGTMAVSPLVAEAVQRIHGRPAPAVVTVAAPDARKEQAAWLAGQDAYDDARARAEGAGASVETLNALLAPADGLVLSCGMRLLPMTLSGYVFLEAVDSSFVSGAEAGPSDLLHVAMALVAPEDCAAILTYDEDFRPRADREAMTVLARRIGGKLTAEDVPALLRHAKRQIETMFPPPPPKEKKESEGSDPLAQRAPAAASA